MVKWFYDLKSLDFEELMGVYIEGNLENGQKNYPYESEQMQLRLAQEDFADYLREQFFACKDSVYAVWEEKCSYISALRLERYQDGFLLEALETRPDCRRKGYGMLLVKQVLAVCVANGWLPVYSHVSKRNRPSMELHLACGFQKLYDFAKYIDGTIKTNAETLIYK